MTLNKRLIEYRKGYKHWLKTAYTIPEFYTALFDNVVEFFKAFGRLLLNFIIAITFPLWFIPVSYIDYKLEYGRLKIRFADCHVELTDDYQPKEDGETT